VLLRAQPGQHLRLLAAAAAGVQHPLTRRRHPPRLELLVDPADVDVVVEPVAARAALEAPVPARQPLERETPTHLGHVIGDLDQPRDTPVNGVGPRTGGTPERTLEYSDRVFFTAFGHLDRTPALRAGEQLDKASSHGSPYSGGKHVPPTPAYPD